MKYSAILTICILVTACATAPRPTVSVAPASATRPRVAAAATLSVAADPTSIGMSSDVGLRLDSIVAAGLAEGAAPGASLAVGRYGRIVRLRGYGKIDTADGAPAVTDSTLFDMASLTKVIATTTAAMILEEEGKLDIDRPVRFYLPELDAPDKANITVRMILTHHGGFESGASLWKTVRGRDAYLRGINGRPLAYVPGDSTIYSDWDLVLTGFILERLAGRPLDAFLKERVWQPLGMRDTDFNPLASGPMPADSDCTAAFRADAPLLARIATTEIDTVYRHQHIHGIVHDENACALGGVAGHAGLFSSARDLAVFAHMMLNGGEYGGVRIVRATTIARWTARQTRSSSRALGWDTPTPGSSAGLYFSPRSFGHTGFTGTSIWLDPERGLFVVLLTNRVNPTRRNTRHEPLRKAVADAAEAAILDAPLIEWQRTVR
jgi:CubicO group peptidase (beta-lactamase class C family)